MPAEHVANAALTALDAPPVSSPYMVHPIVDPRIEPGDDAIANLYKKIERLQKQVDGLETYTKPVDDKYWWIGDGLVHAVFLFTVVIFVLIRVSETTRHVMLHPAFAVFAGCVALGSTCIIMILVQRDVLTFMQYRHLARASLLSIVSTYAGAYLGPEAGTLGIAIVFYVFFTYDKRNERQNRIKKKKKADAIKGIPPRKSKKNAALFRCFQWLTGGSAKNEDPDAQLQPISDRV